MFSYFGLEFGNCCCMDLIIVYLLKFKYYLQLILNFMFQNDMYLYFL